MITRRSRTCILLMALLVAGSLQLQARQLSLPLVTFSSGDILVSLEPGPVQWYTANGLVLRVLAQTSNYYTSNVYRFNLATGAQLASFNSGTPANTVVGIRVVR